MVEDLLREYFKANQRYPNKIVFLRDGVSEGQFRTVIKKIIFLKRKRFINSLLIDEKT
jgi:hypothetical protein